MSEPQQYPPPPKPQVLIKSGTEDATASKKLVVLADLNANPPEADPTEPPSRSLFIDETQDKPSRAIVVEAVEGKKSNKPGKSRSSKSTKLEASAAVDFGAADGEADQPGPGPGPGPTSREDKVSSLKTGLVHVAKKMPKNAHAHFILGLMYQRLGQPQKAVSAYEKAEEILLRCEAEVARPDLLSLVQVHHAQCILLENAGDGNSDKELEAEELDEILSRLKESMQSDIRQAAVWNTLGLILLKSGRLQSAVSVLSSLLAIDPSNYDCLGNLGIAYLQIGNLEHSEKCFQDLILKDQNHPGAFINYSAILLCKYGSVVAGAGANASEGSCADQFEAVNVAKQFLLASLKVDPKAAHIWANLADAYYVTGDYRSSSKCLEKAARLEPSCMSTRYAAAVHRIKDAERSQAPSEQLCWAGNEMASILREGESVPIELPIAWAGLAMVHKVQHEIAAAFSTEQNELVEVQERAFCSLKQAAAEDPDDGVQWHQLGLHCLCAREFKAAQKYFKVAVAHIKECGYAWSNLGISLQLSEESTQAEEVYKRALTCATTKQVHSIYSNLGNLYRQQRKYERAKAMFSKALEYRPGYAPALNNLGLVFVAEGQWEEAKYCFDKALQSDPLLDAAKSNMMKAVAMSSLSAGLASCHLHD